MTALHTPQQLDSLIRGSMDGEMMLVSIDGPCGSGKTTLSEKLSLDFGWQIIHMDDYYLPWKRRADDWQERVAGNMDLLRIEDELLLPLSENKSARYRAYDCRRDVFTKSSVIPAKGIIAVEGNYSQMPQLRRYFRQSVYVTLPRDLRLQRLKAREGSYYAVFEKVWEPLDQRYQKTLHIRAHADVIYQEML